jgi:hypothetical protein
MICFHWPTSLLHRGINTFVKSFIESDCWICLTNCLPVYQSKSCCKLKCLLLLAPYTLVYYLYVRLKLAKVNPLEVLSSKGRLLALPKNDRLVYTVFVIASIFIQVMNKLNLTGQNPGPVFNSRCGRAWLCHATTLTPKTV